MIKKFTKLFKIFKSKFSTPTIPGKLHIWKRSDNMWGRALYITHQSSDGTTFACHGFSGLGEFHEGDLIACSGWSCLDDSCSGMEGFVPKVTPVLCKIYNLSYYRDPRDMFNLRLEIIPHSSDLTELGWTREQYRRALVEHQPWVDPTHYLMAAGMRVS